MVTDNTTIFTSEEFAQFYKEEGILKKFCAAGHPATNDLTECNCQTRIYLYVKKFGKSFFTTGQWEVSCGTVPESTDPNTTGCDEADKIPRVISTNSTSTHINQLRSTEVLLAARKTVHFDPQSKSPISNDRQLNKPNLGDLTEIMDPYVVLPEAEQPDLIEQEEEVPVVDFQSPDQMAQQECPHPVRASCSLLISGRAPL
ncbi:hypothetical protein PR048_026959 [Dryococelus australis]|uniref:Integrase catalytic domain-containing protein n=1 Tax=Dryococelus australis TaxID=614101 RepID=A0ABQ9GMT4_9NEOP|nr:hypothetical protein PR048_026959 [Dryococelus australis]